MSRQIQAYEEKGLFRNKIAIVTASTNGIGFAIAKRLAQEGAKVIISSRNKENVNRALSKLANEGLDNQVVGAVCHVSKAEDRKKIIEEAKRMGGLDILISCAGVNPEAGPILNCTEKGWDKTFEVNVKSGFMLVKEALPLLRQRGGGRILFLSSLSAYSPPLILGLYAVSKIALITLTKTLAKQLATENITVNCIAPGLIKTAFAEILLKDEALMNTMLNRIYMKRIGSAAEVAGVAVFLVSDDASYITGETVVVSGGTSTHL